MMHSQGFAKRTPLAEFPEQSEGQRGVKVITLAVGDSLVAMHTCQGGCTAQLGLPVSMYMYTCVVYYHMYGSGLCI